MGMKKRKKRKRPALAGQINFNNDVYVVRHNLIDINKGKSFVYCYYLYLFMLNTTSDYRNLKLLNESMELLQKLGKNEF